MVFYLGLSVLLVRLLLSVPRLQPVGTLIICGILVINSVQTYARAESWADTETYLEKLLVFEPGFDLALMQSANIAFNEGRYAEANNYYKRLFGERPNLIQSVGNNFVQSTLRQAEELTIAKNYKSAFLVIEEAVAVIPDSSELYNGLGIVHYVSGNQLEAEKNWKLALQFDPLNKEAGENLKLLKFNR